MYGGQGFWLCQKRLSSGRFRWWPDATSHPTNPTTATLAAHQLAVL
ncbi:MAG: transposase, partial [Planctomycetaceae bacterium]|nr:transposase [Planctomycetaceae bacterium]